MPAISIAPNIPTMPRTTPNTIFLIVKAIDFATPTNPVLINVNNEENLFLPYFYIPLKALLIPIVV
jgi:hypothetical protein